MCGRCMQREIDTWQHLLRIVYSLQTSMISVDLNRACLSSLMSG